MGNLVDYELDWSKFGQDGYRGREAGRNTASHINAAPRYAPAPVIPPDWMGEGACGGDNAVKFEAVFVNAGARAIAEAKAVCMMCSVRQDCLDFQQSMEVEERTGKPARVELRFGVFGGLSPAERALLAKESA